jgi:glucosamine--fructose-6-phosphate aminotransferase (isomerizing)
MCGISFVVSKKNNDITDIILTSITLIQNRGYDSYGIALQTINSSKYDILKYISNDNETIELLKLDIKKYTDVIYRAFAHTRWSTHGEKNIINGHPHISLHKHIILVHNGIINNYEKIKSFLMKNKYKFYSDTDSEIIANLIEYNLIVDNNSIEVSIKKTIEELEGTFALIIAYKDMIYAVRRGMPLLLGKNKDIIMVTSETTGFAGYISKYIILNDVLFNVFQYYST